MEEMKQNFQKDYNAITYATWYRLFIDYMFI